MKKEGSTMKETTIAAAVEISVTPNPQLTTPTVKQGAIGNDNAAFWEKDGTLQVLNTLDVWASYRWARRLRSDPPTMDAIFERPVPTMEPWIDERTGLRMVEEMHIPTTTRRRLGQVELLALSVQYALEVSGHGTMLTNLLLNWYPRSGPYERPSRSSDESRIGRAVTRGVGSIERAIVEELLKAGGRTVQMRHAV